MRSSLKVVLIALLLILSLAGGAAAQAGRNRQQSTEPQKKTQKPENTPTDESKSAQPEPQESEANINPQDVETIKIETNLVTVPVIVSDRSDKYVADLKQEEFTVYEDGVKQDISFFETVTTPFHVVLMLDTSASTQEKFGQIQQAAIAFTEQLQKEDRVKVISFDDRVRDLCDFTSDRAVLQWAIRDTRQGQGTKLYDAMRAGLNALQRIKGRKAIVIFTDGVDSYSDRETFDKNVRMIEEAGIIIYPIRYDTREELERLFRQQQGSGKIIDLGTILGGGRPRNTTPPTFPGGSQTPFPTGPTGGTKTTTLPGGVVITTDSNNRRDRNDRYPPDSNDPNSRYPDSRNDPTQPSSRRPTANDSISAELDMLYRTADAYLNEIANKSGGQLYRADTLSYLPKAFAQIAAELRTQYALGYYPSKATARDGKYHKIKVSITRNSASVRARPGYRAPSGSK
ncbi:MAG: Ca-activated chloride channel [Acidobacteriota bacterium]|jgi:Mg-chelatase subunit ChlD|nr:Ca-activated chloride channel [Acidobacteriota bacterium]